MIIAFDGSQPALRRMTRWHGDRHADAAGRRQDSLEMRSDSRTRAFISEVAGKLNRIAPGPASRRFPWTRPIAGP
jgi:hypothetical protein